MRIDIAARLRRRLAGLAGLGLLIPACAGPARAVKIELTEMTAIDDSDDLRDAPNIQLPQALHSAARQSEFSTVEFDRDHGSQMEADFAKFMHGKGYRKILIEGRWRWADRDGRPVPIDRLQQEFNLFLLKK